MPPNTSITKVITMTDDETANPMIAIRDAEDVATDYRAQLLDADAENAQLWHDFNGLYDIVVGINNRIKAVEYWGSEPVTTLGEIKDMLKEIVE